MKKIAVVSIFIGDYDLLWKEFIESALVNFLPDSNKDFFIFTDSEDIINYKNSMIHPIKVSNEGWVLNTTRRFDFILSISDVLKIYDFCFFYQSNSLFLSKIFVEEILQDNLITVFKHPILNAMHPYSRTYERRKFSSAYVKYGDEPDFYYQACAFGGPSELFINLSYLSNILLIQDRTKSIMATWHDESYFNKVLIEYKINIKISSSKYIYPENLVPIKDIKVLMRDKNKYFISTRDKYKYNFFSKVKLSIYHRLKVLYESILIKLDR
jgi:hypothetical protein